MKQKINLTFLGFEAFAVLWLSGCAALDIVANTTTAVDDGRRLASMNKKTTISNFKEHQVPLNANERVGNCYVKATEPVMWCYIHDMKTGKDLYAGSNNGYAKCEDHADIAEKMLAAINAGGCAD